MSKESELQAFRMRQLDYLCDRIPTTPLEIEPYAQVPLAKQQEQTNALFRVYKDLEKVFDALVHEHDRLVGNPARGMRGDYYFHSPVNAANAIRRMEKDIENIKEEIRVERAKQEEARRFGTYDSAYEAEVNRICLRYQVTGIQTHE